MEIEDFGFAGMEGLGCVGAPKPINEVKSIADKLQSLQKWMFKYELDYAKFLEVKAVKSEVPAVQTSAPDLSRVVMAAEIDTSTPFQELGIQLTEKDQHQDDLQEVFEDDDDEHSLASLLQRQKQADLVTQFPDQTDPASTLKELEKQDGDPHESVPNTPQSSGFIHPDWGSYVMPSFADSFIPSDLEAMIQNILPATEIVPPAAEEVETVLEQEEPRSAPAPINPEVSQPETEAAMEVDQEILVRVPLEIENDQMLNASYRVNGCVFVINS